MELIKKNYKIMWEIFQDHLVLVSSWCCLLEERWTQIPSSTGPLLVVLANITSYDVVPLIRIFHSWNVGCVDDFQCLNMTVSWLSPWSNLNTHFLVGLGFLFHLTKDIDEETSAGLIPPISPKNSNTPCHPWSISVWDARRFPSLFYISNMYYY